MIPDMADEGASARGKKAIEALAKRGQEAGFQVKLEYHVPHGRVDVVWSASAPLPGLADDSLPLVGFEVESSWRSRKHVKGDIMNLVSLQAAIGVILLLGDYKEVAGLQKTTKDLVAQWPARILVWSQEELDALIAGKPANLTPKASKLPSHLTPPAHAGKYRGLWMWLRSQPLNSVAATFDQVEGILGFPLPPSARNHLAHWYGYKGTAVGRAIRDSGWRATSVNLNAETVTFERVVPGSNVS